MKIRLLAMACAMTLTAVAQQRQETTLTDNWQFSQDRQTWKTVSVPWVREP